MISIIEYHNKHVQVQLHYLLVLLYYSQTPSTSDQMDSDIPGHGCKNTIMQHHHNTHQSKHHSREQQKKVNKHNAGMQSKLTVNCVLSSMRRYVVFKG